MPRAGPRIAALEIGGWDTHTAQPQRLAGVLRQLDTGLAALKTGLGEAWRQTAVLTMTEFGRTVRMNGTRGTDHGTGTVAFVLGGAVAGGRVVADWPGLGSGQAVGESRPATDVRPAIGRQGIAGATSRPDGGRAGDGVSGQCCGRVHAASCHRVVGAASGWHADFGEVVCQYNLE